MFTLAALRPSVSSSLRIFLASTLAALLAGCGAGNFGPSSATNANANQVKLEGFVHGGQQPISGATVQLYTTGTTADQSAAIPLIAAAPLTDAAGGFNITGLYTCPSITAEVYLIASGGNPGLSVGTNNAQSVLMAALGPCGNLTSATHIIINEVTTVGSIYPITPYMANYLNVGAAPANQLTLANDFMLINEFIDTNGGQSPGPQLPPGYTAPVANVNSLANSISACTNSPGGVAGDGSPCGNLFLYAKPPSSPAPTNTADAILDIANNPTQNVAAIYALTPGYLTFQPALSSAPTDWTLQILPDLTLATLSNLVGVGSATNGTITLAAPAPSTGLTVNLVSSTPANITVNSPVVIPSGATSAPFTYTGVAVGNSTITASATGYFGSSVTLTATSSLISLGTIPTVAPGQSTSLPLSLGTVAPPGGVTISFTSSNANATVTPSVFIAGGLQIPTTNPQVTGALVGTGAITATAPGFAPGARNFSVSVTATLPATFGVPIGVIDNETLTISAPAPTGGITFNLMSGNTAIFTVPATVTVPAGATTVSIPIDGTVNGTATLYANSPNIPQATSSITVNGAINTAASVTTGQQLQTSSSFSFAVAPPSAMTATVTSSNPLVAVVSISPTVQGTATASFPGITSTSGGTYYLQGVAVGSTTLTIAAPGYTSTTVSVVIDPSGFIIYSPSSISTTSLSTDTSITVAPVYLNPSTGAYLNIAAVAPAAAGVSVPVASSNTLVGTIPNSPASFAANATTTTVNFHPVGPGTANISITQPAGFSVSTTANTQLIVATVTAPPITGSTAVTTGQGLEVTGSSGLSQTPTTPTNMTVTSNNPGVAVVSASPTVAGSASITFPNLVAAGGQTYYVQGISVGTTTLTISAPAFTSATVAITVDPSGFTIYSPGSINTTTFAAPSSITIVPAILNLGSLTYLTNSTVIPQVSPVNVPFTSSNTATGTIATSPIVMAAGSTTGTTTFQPVGAGTSNLTIGTPAGFSTPNPASSLTIVATVTAPLITGSTTITTGANMEVSGIVSLPVAPPTPVTVTLTISNPAVATISGSPTLAGAAQYTFPNTVAAGGQTFYVQGQTVGNATITASAPGYQSATFSVTVDPSGFTIYSPGAINTTTFGGPTSITLVPAYLNPSTLTYVTNLTLNPGIGTISVPVASSANQVGTVTTPATFTGGSTTATVTFSPLAAGATNISITQPAGFTATSTAGDLQIVATVTAPPISASSSVITGTNLQVSGVAGLSATPPSPVTMTIVCADPTIATISASTTVVGSGTLTFPGLTAAGGQTFYVQGHNPGSTSCTASAAGYSNATINVTTYPSGFTIYSPGSISNTTTFSAPTSVTLVPAILNPGSLTYYTNATLSPGVGSPQVTVASSNTAVGTVSTPVTFTAASTTGTFSFQPVGVGTTNLSITQPAGYSATSTAGDLSIVATVTGPSVTAQASVIAGVSMQSSSTAGLGVSPPAPVTLTVTSSNPAVAVISTSPSVIGTAAISFPGLAAAGAQTYYVQGVATGTATITVTATGYSSATTQVNIYPSGFTIYSPGSITTSTFSTATTVTIVPAILNPNLLTYYTNSTLSPGVNVAVPVTSGTPAVGTVTSPANLTGNTTTGTFSFQPTLLGGTTVLSIGTPAGFSTPSQSSSTQITATVNAPTISAAATVLTGALLQAQSSAGLSVAPPAPVTLTITSANPAIATVSTSNTVTGTAAIAFAGLAVAGGQTYYVQGQAVGTTTLTISAPGYQTTTVTVTVDPSGFVYYSASTLTTTAGAAATTLYVEPAILTPGILTFISQAEVNPGLGTVSVPIGSTSPQIGTVSPASLNFTAGSNLASFSFTPLQTGTTDINIVSQPAGFTTPSQPVTQQIVVTVN